MEMKYKEFCHFFMLRELGHEIIKDFAPLLKYLNKKIKKIIFIA